ncbi:hypothetical protein Pfo_026574 [Paulownia fortunei]|nr:hypothetical protein Pfo_026574 [Paulownia fortunei]
MASKFLFLPLLLALALHFSTLSAIQLEAGGAPPVIHIISAVAGNNLPLISIRIKAGGNLKGSAELSPRQDYQINADVNDVYYASAVFGLRFASFHAYEPARDKGQAAIYWRADNLGFAISYDKTNYKRVALWESG